MNIPDIIRSHGLTALPGWHLPINHIDTEKDGEVYLIGTDDMSSGVMFVNCNGPNELILPLESRTVHVGEGYCLVSPEDDPWASHMCIITGDYIDPNLFVALRDRGDTIARYWGPNLFYMSHMFQTTRPDVWRAKYGSVEYEFIDKGHWYIDLC
ncbi:hypothetical protein [Shimia aestuarii]|uniref:Uncharacterized protein n=1 Tax=Shimia aestuarii TaxID=254406 RepID=A0A1I4P143_9RHOB|nr:hypothetical protein [Shimia aestuarii]SFM21521.1 hypothetical protein SAMN04488042_10535 [Shimia aestuarii]